MDSATILFFSQKLFALLVTRDGKKNNIEVSTAGYESISILYPMYVLSIAKPINYLFIV